VRLKLESATVTSERVTAWAKRATAKADGALVKTLDSVKALVPVKALMTVKALAIAIILISVAAAAYARTAESVASPSSAERYGTAERFGTPERLGSPEALRTLHYKAVLVAGDRSAPAFDHATEAMRARLIARHVAPADIQRLSAAPVARDEVRSSTLGHVLSAIARMHPAPGQGCFVFMTSHGAYKGGLVLVPSRDYLTPAALDNALTAGCGNAPTVAIVSGCFSGTFTKPPMARANRIVLTAAREDRPSFGCGADFEYTVYDRCLLEAMDLGGTWPDAYARIQTCVTGQEHEMGFRASEPRAWFGAAVREMPVLQ
jgi:hypothetical protein